MRRVCVAFFSQIIAKCVNFGETADDAKMKSVEKNKIVNS